MQKGKGFAKTFQDFNDLIIREQKKLYNEVFLNHKELINQVDSTKRIGYYMATFENNQPHFQSREFGLLYRGDTADILPVSNYNYVKEKGYVRIYSMGVSIHAMRYYFNHPELFTSLDHVRQKLTSLIKIEADIDTALVSMPVDIISIYKNGTKRFLNLTDCWPLR